MSSMYSKVYSNQAKVKLTNELNKHFVQFILEAVQTFDLKSVTWMNEEQYMSM